MTSDLDLRGVWVPLITPFDAEGAVDVAAIERLCHEYIGAGAKGIVALGTTGEASALDEAEKRRHRRARAVSHRAAHRRHWYQQPRSTIRRREQSQARRPVAVLVVVPYYVRRRRQVSSRT
jgi:4-hydroxy-tetrahydrodipicolinate synthase